MSRSVPLWVGRTDDTPIPPRVKLRIFERCRGRCHRCERKIPVGDAYIFEHLVALINGGANAEDNIVLTCSWCKPLKDAEDVAEKAATARVRSKHLGITRSKHPVPGSRNTPWKRKMSGQTVRREQ